MSDKIMNFNEAAIAVKSAIIRSRYQAATLVNKKLPSLYYAIGQYVSVNSRGAWGRCAIKQISEILQNELPGLRGFSEASIKRMRSFYEGWQPIFANRPLTMDDLESNRQLSIGDLQNGQAEIDLSLLYSHLSNFEYAYFSVIDFYKVGTTHHYEIVTKEKSLDGRLFYISKCADEFLSVEALKTYLRGELYARTGTMPNNFMKTLPEQEQARRAIRSFKDEYFLDFINIEDEHDPEERVFERSIIANIKQFVMAFGNKFCFIGNRQRVIVHEDEFYID
jgi:predicted nuclease of restriction endonuclease-like (RecB) superfamily